ncbi:MAG: hypothetical protein VB140_08245, partial [Burkholderia sp.]
PFASASSTAWRTSLVRNPFVSPELCPSDAMASSRSIYATTPIRYINTYPLGRGASFVFDAESLPL